MTLNNPNFTTYLPERVHRINNFLAKILPTATQIPQNLHAAMRYAVLNGGKRLRPILVYLTGEIFGASLDQLDAVAAALELIHSSSLVHDDLPAMDNDTLRRGKPTCHIAFDEATAILVGDALILLAFDILAANETLDATIRTKLMRTLAIASGSHGMAGGQDLDIQATKQPLPLEQLEYMYRLKTGALISASIQMGTLAAGVTYTTTYKDLDTFANALGLAFQIQDDILDIESSEKVLGKNINSDKNKGKITYPELVGLNNAKTKVETLWKEAFMAVDNLATHNSVYDLALLKAFATYVKQRNF